MLQLDPRCLARIAAAALLLLASTACGSECGDFYGTYESCGFGEAGDAAVDSCNERVDADANCENAYKNLNACIDDLDEECSYPEACSAALEESMLACSQF